MKKCGSFKRTMIILLTLCLAGGCSPPEEGQIHTEGGTLGLTPNLDYEVPESTPGILVDQAGYPTGGVKMAVFRGEGLSEDFQVIAADTGRVVYTGTLEDQGYNPVMGEYNSYGYFTQVEEPGEYYLQAPVVGRSYSFMIGDHVYDEIFDRACRQYYLNRCGMTLTAQFAGEDAHNACHTRSALLREDAGVQMDVGGGWHLDEDFTRDTVRGCRAAADMLLSYELYGDVFADSAGIPESGNGIPDILDEIRYEMDWLLKMQEQRTGGVYSAVKAGPETAPGAPAGADSYVEPVTPEATAAFSAVLSKFSYLYQSFDREYATACLKAADRAWKYLEKNREQVDEGQRFFAAAELYRASGEKSYHTAVREYLSPEKYYAGADDDVFHGCVTYISTKQPVDVALCGDIMEKLMSEAEEIAAEAAEYQYLVDRESQADNPRLLRKMMRLIVAEHIITNHEYETVIENHLHYFLGRNPKAVSYIDGTGMKSYRDLDWKFGIMNQPDLNARFIFLLSEVICNYHSSS